MNRMMAPFAAPTKAPVCREKGAESGVRALWGQQWTRLPFDHVVGFAGRGLLVPAA
jgi:hypothetical protein